MSIFHSMGILFIIFALAYLTESATEYLFGTPMDKFGLSRWKWSLMYISLVVGIGLAFFYKLDLVALLASVVGEDITASWVGFVLTGFGIGRGANWLHQFVEKYFPGKKEDGKK